MIRCHILWRLIWVYTIFLGLSVRIHMVNMVSAALSLASGRKLNCLLLFNHVAFYFGTGSFWTSPICNLKGNVKNIYTPFSQPCKLCLWRVILLSCVPSITFWFLAGGVGDLSNKHFLLTFLVLSHFSSPVT